MRAFHTVHDPAQCIRRLDRQRLGITASGHKREHHHVGIAIEKHVFDKFLGPQTVEITERAGFSGESAACLGRPRERIGGCCLDPCAGWVNEVPLYIEDKLTLTAEPRLRELRLQGGFSFHLEEAAALARCGVGRVEREQRARRAASRNQKFATANPQALGVVARRLVRQAVSSAVGWRERNRREFSVGSRIQLDRQPPAFGIDHVFHVSEYRLRFNRWRMADGRFFRFNKLSVAKGMSPILESPPGKRSRSNALALTLCQARRYTCVERDEG